MSQNIISLSYTAEQFAAILAILGDLESKLQGLTTLSISERRALMKMGAKSETFCRDTLSALSLYPQIVPPTLDLGDAQADLAALDQLRPIQERLRRLSERADDTRLALGSDVMDAALHGYRALRFFGKGAGLETLRKGLSGRFNKSAKPAPEPAAT